MQIDITGLKAHSWLPGWLLPDTASQEAFAVVQETQPALLGDETEMGQRVVNRRKLQIWLFCRESMPL
jgi:hypothetical protein